LSNDHSCAECPAAVKFVEVGHQRKRVTLCLALDVPPQDQSRLQGACHDSGTFRPVHALAAEIAPRRLSPGDLVEIEGEVEMVAWRNHIAPHTAT